MESYIVEWLNLLGRWVHMITGIAWIGASFYFVWLDNHLREPESARDRGRGVSGELWSVHGGGFYHSQKYGVAPPKLPPTLHWFKWEAYSTWLSGMFLLALIYWYSAEIYLLNPDQAWLGKAGAIALSIAVLVLGWLIYDRVCESPLGRNERVLGIVVGLLAVFAAWGLCQVFSGRGAYIHFGAMFGTIMVANVFFVIIPGQQELVTAKKALREPDPIHGIRGKQRSVHNTYFTLPVLFAMISNHSALAYGHAYNWLILVGLSLAGALIRVYFVARHRGPASPLSLITAVALLLAIAVVIAPWHRPVADAAGAASVRIEQVVQIVSLRCTPCHAENPSQPGFATAPKGVVLEGAQDVRTHALAIHQQTVATQAMPIANLTQMSEAERAVIDRWYADWAMSQ